MMSRIHRCRRVLRRASAFLALLPLLGASSAPAAPPTVNGLFYGDGDDARYQPYATSNGGSVLYSYFDAPNNRLYVALVVSHSVNDLVCSPQNNNSYTQSAGWNNHRSCKRASDSEYAQFTLQCAPNSPNSWFWQQSLGCAQNAANPPSNWVSNSSCPTSAGSWPPSIVSSSSWVANVNAYQANPTPAWNLYAHGTDIDNWKSPFLSSSPNNVTLVPGYPTYSSGDYRWEWSMVYEWSVNLGTGGTNCGNQAIWFITGQSHHSPAKNGPENDPFPPPSGNPILSDWGDAPSSYGTTDASLGPRHYITVTGPRLGQDIQAEQDGQPSSGADGDGDEEDGITVNVTSDWTPGSVRSFDAQVSNASGGALLGGWFDWNGDGDFADPGEFFSWSVIQGSNSRSVTVGSGFNWQTSTLYARFRIFSSGSVAPGGSLNQADFLGTATDGEVEDYVFAPGTLPVTLNAFTTEGSPGGEMAVRWQTASETDNVAFEIWGLVDGQWQVLSDLVETRGGSSALPQSYQVEIDAPPGLTKVQLVDYDTRGRLERFGPYRLGRSYGEVQPARRIDWTGPRAERTERLREQGFADTSRARGAGVARRRAGETPGAARWKKVRQDAPLSGSEAAGHGSALRIDTRRGGARGTASGVQGVRIETAPLTHVAVTAAGVQRVTYEALRAGGLDLAGVPASHVAVTWRGEPVARWVDGPGTFGPGSAIEFVSRPPSGDDALYIDANLYQVSVDRTRVRDAAKAGQGRIKGPSRSYLAETWSDRPVSHYHQSPTGDPWIERAVFVRGGRPATVTLDLPITGPVADGESQLVLGLGAATDLADLRDAAGTPIPEHNVEVWVAAPGGAFTYVTASSVSGREDWEIVATLPAGSLATGVNRVQLRFSTDYLFSYVVVDRYGVRYPSPYLGPSLGFAPDPWADGYRIEGFGSAGVVAYAEGASGSLTRIDPRVEPSGGGYAVEVRQTTAARFWVTASPHTPDVFTTEAPGDLLAGPADLVVIAGSSFVGTRALDDYLAQKAAFDPVVVDVEDVYNAVGYGMALPSAITDYLAARDAVYPFSHVQLVGTDCYDRRNHVSQCVSFVPLPTATVGFNTFSPSQNRLVDLDGDGIGDKAVAQFSVRSEAELATIVGKAASWDASGLSGEGSALLIAEESDGRHDFAAQVERLAKRLGWSGAELLRLSEHSDIRTARDAMSSALAAGRSLTVFSGHSSPVVWAFRSLLTPAGAAALTNQGRPTIMVPLACETTYDISPNANVLGHQLLFAGDNGALAISGAVALSSLEENERMARRVLEGLQAGLTLGQAVLSGRAAVGSSSLELQDNWITQGDVTLRLNR